MVVIRMSPTLWILRLLARAALAVIISVACVMTAFAIIWRSAPPDESEDDNSK